MQPVLKELMSVKGLILLIALVALGLSITAVVQGGCGSSFGNTELCNSKCPEWTKTSWGTEQCCPRVNQSLTSVSLKDVLNVPDLKLPDQIPVDSNWVCKNIGQMYGMC